MQPRVLFRTHYQVDEPTLMEFLVRRCTSAVKSAYSEAVAERLAKEIQRLGKPFNVPAGGYALDLGRGLGLVNEQNVWTDKGHLVNLEAEIVEGGWDDQLPLSLQERLLHLRLFLEADGAALLYLAYHLLEHKEVPNSDEDWNTLAKELFTQIYSDYLQFAGTTADRVALRTEVDRIHSRGYKGKSGPHKMFIHLQTLYRLGLVDRDLTVAARKYLLPGMDDGQGLRTLINEVRDVYGLEQVIKERRVLEVCARILDVGQDHQQPSFEPEEFLRLVAPKYRQVMVTGVPLAALTTLIEAVQIDLLINCDQLVPYSTAQELLQRAQRERPTEIRFHVDRKGTPAFLRLSDNLAAA